MPTFLVQNIAPHARNSSQINAAIVTAATAEDARAAANAAARLGPAPGETRFGPLATVTEYVGDEPVILVDGNVLANGVRPRGG